MKSICDAATSSSYTASHDERTDRIRNPFSPPGSGGRKAARVPEWTYAGRKAGDHIRVAAPRETLWGLDSCRHRTLGHNSQREFVIARAATVSAKLTQRFRRAGADQLSTLKVDKDSHVGPACQDHVYFRCGFDGSLRNSPSSKCANLQAGRDRDMSNHEQIRITGGTRRMVPKLPGHLPARMLGPTRRPLIK